MSGGLLVIVFEAFRQTLVLLNALKHHIGNRTCVLILALTPVLLSVLVRERMLELVPVPYRTRTSTGTSASTS